MVLSRSALKGFGLGVLCLTVLVGGVVPGFGQSAPVDRVLFTAMRSPVGQNDAQEATIAERLLLSTWRAPERAHRVHYASLSGNAGNERRVDSRRTGGTTPYRQVRRSGWITMMLTEGRRIQRLGADQAVLRPRAVCLLDSQRLLASTGRLAQDPSGLYGGFDISVKIAEYRLDLYGTRWDGQRTLLFTSRVGLGSEEFPTPRGSFYLTRIFDDSPLWIPPPSDWAWGQIPSHSVYGGHMLPLLKKVSVAARAKNEEPITDLDSVADPVKMVDGGMYRIHGTDSPWSIGSGQSHGCIRMLNSTVRQLADTLKMYVGVNGRGQAPNGPYANLARPVRLVLH
jgi:hypothetical protein